MMRHAFRIAARIVQTVGIALLTYVAFILVRAKVFQAYESFRFARPSQALDSSERGVYPAWAANAVVGRIEIPRLHLSTMILEGDDDKQLALGAGHVPGTATPGSRGNVVIAAHRDTFFRPLRGISANDQIVLKTRAGSFNYRVDSVDIVDPADTSAMRPTADSSLTLITCYPFSFIGPAPKRFIVHAARN